MTTPERQLEDHLIETLRGLKYEHRADIRDLAALEKNFRAKFESLNHVHLTGGEFQRLLDEIVTPDVSPPRTLRERKSFTRDNGTPLNYTLVNIADWCRTPSRSSANSASTPTTATTVTTSSCSSTASPPRRSNSKPSASTPAERSSRSSNTRTTPATATRARSLFRSTLYRQQPHRTWYFANNNARHFSFNADERFLPIYQHAGRGQREDQAPRHLRRSFLPKCTLGRMISRYMVLVASEQKLIMMRPYQIYAVKNIVACIEREPRQRLRLAYHRQRQNAHQLQGSTLLKANPTSRSVCSSSTAKTSTARPAKSSTASRKGASKKIPTPRALVRPPAFRRRRRQGHRLAPFRNWGLC